ncbi:MAG: DUF1972 domain-containing protein [Firmicutes bacterium]|nr:DUF1972 domain-containing protein [Bacillota bacterium]
MSSVQHVFIIGAKSIGQYGGYETFVDKLTEQHQNDPAIQYHIACKANGDGSMDEAQLKNIEILKTNKDGTVSEFIYHNAHIFKIKCPQIGPAVAIYYDWKAFNYSINYCKVHQIEAPIFYVLTCRIGPFISKLVKKVRSVKGKYYLNPDGHEWLRKKWSPLVRRYWKYSEGKMVKAADLVICDSKNIEKYIKAEYHHPCTTFIAYGADIKPSCLSDDDSKFVNWLEEKKIESGNYYLIVGRFVPENNYETMIREFMKSNTKRDLVIVTNLNTKLRTKLESELHFSSDPRIKFVGTVYDKELLKKIREKAFGYLHGHEVGGTNPSLLEALASTDINLLLDVGFNREVGENAAIYWTKENSSLSSIIDDTDRLNPKERELFSSRAKERINDDYNWTIIGDKYKKAWSTEDL